MSKYNNEYEIEIITQKVNQHYFDFFSSESCIPCLPFKTYSVLDFYSIFHSKYYAVEMLSIISMIAKKAEYLVDELLDEIETLNAELSCIQKMQMTGGKTVLITRILEIEKKLLREKSSKILDDIKLLVKGRTKHFVRTNTCYFDEKVVHKIKNNYYDEESEKTGNYTGNKYKGLTKTILEQVLSEKKEQYIQVLINNKKLLNIYGVCCIAFYSCPENILINFSRNVSFIIKSHLFYELYGELLSRLNVNITERKIDDFLQKMDLPYPIVDYFEEIGEFFINVKQSFHSFIIDLKRYTRDAGHKKDAIDIYFYNCDRKLKEFISFPSTQESICRLLESDLIDKDEVPNSDKVLLRLNLDSDGNPSLKMTIVSFIQFLMEAAHSIDNFPASSIIKLFDINKNIESTVRDAKTKVKEKSNLNNPLLEEFLSLDY